MVKLLCEEGSVRRDPAAERALVAQFVPAQFLASRCVPLTEESIVSLRPDRLAVDAPENVLDGRRMPPARGAETGDGPVRQWIAAGVKPRRPGGGKWREKQKSDQRQGSSHAYPPASRRSCAVAGAGPPTALHFSRSRAARACLVTILSGGPSASVCRTSRASDVPIHSRAWIAR